VRESACETPLLLISNSYIIFHLPKWVISLLHRRRSDSVGKDLTARAKLNHGRTEEVTRLQSVAAQDDLILGVEGRSTVPSHSPLSFVFLTLHIPISQLLLQLNGLLREQMSI
jgi:hypothetical protein